MNMQEIGYFLFMEEQENALKNRSPEQKAFSSLESPPKSENEEEKKIFPKI